MGILKDSPFIFAFPGDAGYNEVKIFMLIIEMVIVLLKLNFIRNAL